MEKHSLWEAVLTVLANLVSKFVTESRLVVRNYSTDGNSQGYCKVTVSKPYVIKSAVQSEVGEISILIGQEVENGNKKD